MNEPHGLYEAAGRRRGEQRFLIALGLLGLALALVLGAFLTGRALSDGGGADEAQGTTAGEQPGRTEQVEAESLADAAVGRTAPTRRAEQQPDEPATKPEPKREAGRLTGTPYRGPRAVVTPQVARASCRSEDSVNAAGRRVSYAPMNTIDGRRATAWRCDGRGTGDTLRFELETRQRIVAVGLIPGYAKTDPANGVDRYRQNRRVKRVRWTFDGGRFVEQRFDHHPENRALQKMRIPVVKTDTITMEILGSTRASRDSVAISKAWFAAAR